MLSSCPAADEHTGGAIQARLSERNGPIRLPWPRQTARVRSQWLTSQGSGMPSAVPRVVLRLSGAHPRPVDSVE